MNPMVAVYKTTPQEIPATVFAKVDYNAVGGNAGGCWDVANKRLILNRTGFWRLGAAIYWSGADSERLVDGQAIELHAVKVNNGPPIDGGVFLASDCRAAAGHGGQSNNLGNFVFFGAAGDIIEIFAFQNPGDSSTKRINDSWVSVSWFCADYVGDNW